MWAVQVMRVLSIFFNNYNSVNWDLKLQQNMKLVSS